MALAVVLVTRPRESATSRAATGSPVTGIPVPARAAPKVDYTLDLRTGVTSPLPDGVIGSVAEFGRSAWSRYAASPDGFMLAFVGVDDERNAQIFVARLDPRTVPRQATHDSREAMSPAWSPNGTTLAYAGYGADGAATVPNLFVVDVATGRSRQVTDEANEVWASVRECHPTEEPER